MLISLLIFVCFVLGSFLMNEISALIAFDSWATRYFMSLVLSKRLLGAPSDLAHLLEVENVDD